MPKKYVPKKKTSLFRFLPAIILGTVVLVGLLLSLTFLKFAQDTRQQAAENTNKIALSLKSSTVDNDKLKIEVIMNSNGYKIAAVDFQGTLVETKPSDVSIEERNTLALNFIHKKISGDNTNTAFRVVQFASLDPNARTSTNGENITLFSFIITKPKDNQITVSFDTVLSSIALQNGTNVMVEYPARQTLGMSGNGEPDRGIHRTCNEYCADNRECDANLVCYFNRCRHPLNRNSTSCAAPVIRTTTTGSGKGGPTTSIAKTTPSPTPKALATPKASPGYLADVATPATSSTSIPVTPFPSPVVIHVSPFPSPVVTTPSPSPKVSPKPTPQPVVQKSGPNWGLAIFSVIGLLAVAGGLFYVFRKR